MEFKTLTFSQLFLRIALSVSFLSAVADRFGLWGLPGSDGVVWGNWGNFLNYSSAVNSFVPKSFNEILAVIATALELILPLFLLIGYKVKQAAFASGLLLLAFAVSMTISFGFKAPLDYSVWTGAGASFLLSAIGCYSFSLDELLKK